MQGILKHQKKGDWRNKFIRRFAKSEQFLENGCTGAANSRDVPEFNLLIQIVQCGHVVTFSAQGVEVVYPDVMLQKRQTESKIYNMVWKTLSHGMLDSCYVQLKAVEFKLKTWLQFKYKMYHLSFSLEQHSCWVLCKSYNNKIPFFFYISLLTLRTISYGMSLALLSSDLLEPYGSFYLKLLPRYVCA